MHYNLYTKKTNDKKNNLYTFKILDKVDSMTWNDELTKSNYATFFQTTNYLNSNSNDYFPVFIYILDQDDNIVGQLGLRIIKTVVRYSSPFFRRLLHIISSITSRGIWLDGPIIYTNDKNIQLKILQKMLEAVKIVSTKYNLVHIEGYTPGYKLLIDNNYKKMLVENNFIIQNYVTFILDIKKNIDDIWSNLPKRLKQDINRAKRRNITVKQLENYDDLKQYLVLAQQWATTKGIVNLTPIEDVERLWTEHKNEISKFFLAFQDDELISGLHVVFFNKIVQPQEVISSYSKPTSLGGTLLTWTSIEWAKTVNALIYDFTGGKKEIVQNNSDDKNNINSLLYYKSKWGGDEYMHYNIIHISKKYHYVLYKILFNMVRSYHTFKSKNSKSPKDTKYEDT